MKNEKSKQLDALITGWAKQNEPSEERIDSLRKQVSKTAFDAAQLGIASESPKVRPQSIAGHAF